MPAQTATAHEVAKGTLKKGLRNTKMTEQKA